MRRSRNSGGVVESSLLGVCAAQSHSSCAAQCKPAANVMFSAFRQRNET